MPITLNGTTGIVTPKLDALDLELGSKNVVERGSNANGEYVRFADGTQIVIKRFSLSSAINVANYGGFISPFQVWNFPASFSATPALSAVAEGNTSFGILAGTSSTSDASLPWVAVSSQGVATRVASAVAVGRWF